MRTSTRWLLLVVLSVAVGTCRSAPTQPIVRPPGQPPAGPAAPRDLALQVSGPTQALALSFQLTWSAPASGPPPTGYQVEFASTPGFATSVPTRVDGTSVSFTFAFPAKRTWSWRVRALDGAFEGPPSNVVTYVFALPEPQSPLPAPTLLSPADRVVFDLFPRTMMLAWDAVAGAASYGFEVDYCQPDNPWCADERQSEIGRVSADPLSPQPHTATTFTFDFIGAQPGRWAVWAIDEQGRMGVRSPWRSFVHRR